MGRNWHSPKHFDFADSSGKSGAATGGQVVVVDREGAFGRPGQTIICFFNYSFQEALLSAYQSGRFHGEKIGEERARHTMREALGEPPPDEWTPRVSS